MKYGLGATGGRPGYARWSTPLLSSEYQWEGRSCHYAARGISSVVPFIGVMDILTRPTIILDMQPDVPT